MSLAVPVFSGNGKGLVPQLESAGLPGGIVCVRQRDRPAVREGMVPSGIGGTAAQAQEGLPAGGRQGLEHLLQYEAFEETAQVQPHVLPGEADGALSAVQFPGAGLRRTGGRVGRYVEPAPRGLPEGLAELQDQEQFIVTGGFFQGGFPVDPGQQAFGAETVVPSIGLSDHFFHAFAPAAGLLLPAADEQQFAVRVHAGESGI